MPTWILGAAVLLVGWSNVGHLSVVGTVLLILGTLVLGTGLMLLVGQRRVLGYSLSITGALLVPVGLGVVVTVVFLAVTIPALVLAARAGRPVPAEARTSRDPSARRPSGSGTTPP